MPSPPDLATGLAPLLDAAARGDRAAYDRAFALLYDELTALARAQRRRWQGNETVGTTVLVHEAWLKLRGDTVPDAGAPDEGAPGAPAPGDDARPRWQSQRHFFAL